MSCQPLRGKVAVTIERSVTRRREKAPSMLYIRYAIRKSTKHLKKSLFLRQHPRLPNTTRQGHCWKAWNAFEPWLSAALPPPCPTGRLRWLLAYS